VKAPERVLVDDPGPEHVTRFAYYGGNADGRVSTMEFMSERELPTICDGAASFNYTVTRYGVHADSTLCWVLFMHSPIVERGKL
jgi:hypothetical protein